MRVGFSAVTNKACQPLRNISFKADKNAQKTPVDYEKQIAKLEKEKNLEHKRFLVACNFAAMQAEQFDRFVKKSKKQ